MIVEQTQVRNRIDELKLSFSGYNRQLARQDITGERRERLESETQLLSEEIATLETLAQLGRVEPDRARIEAEVRSRVAHVRERIASDPDYRGIPEEMRDQASGELRALVLGPRRGPDHAQRTYHHGRARASRPRPHRPCRPCHPHPHAR